MILIENDKGEKSIIHGKSNTITKVCKSTKSAETRALESALEKSIGIARTIEEIIHGTKFRGKENIPTIPIYGVTDSKTLHDSIYSTKQIQEVSIRGIIAWIKEQLNDEVVKEISWCKSESMLADILTKRNVSPKNILDILKYKDNILINHQC